MLPRINLARTVGSLAICTAMLFGLVAIGASANPPRGPYRDPASVPTQRSLSPADQVRVDRIMRQQSENLSNFEWRFNNAVNRLRATRGLRPLDFNTRQCFDGSSPESQLVGRAFRRGERVTTQLREAIERWVRANPRNVVWDRFLRWSRVRNDNDQDGPPSTGGGGNIAADFALDDIAINGNAEDRDAAQEMGNQPQERDGIPTEDLRDPDTNPQGPLFRQPHIFVVPPTPGVPLPSGMPLPSGSPPPPLPFRLFEPLLIENERGRGRNREGRASCGCSIAPRATTARRSTNIGSLSPLDTPVVPSGQELAGSNVSEVLPGGEFGLLSWTRWQLRGGDGSSQCSQLTPNERLPGL